MRAALSLAPRTLFVFGMLVVALVLPTVALALEATWCHRVRSGETLFSLARRYQTTVDQLRTLNRLRADDVLRTGTVLALPSIHRLRGGRIVIDARRLTARPGNLRRENAVARRQRLSRIADTRMLGRFVKAGLLVPVPAQTRTFWVDGVRPEFQVARPWARQFIEQLAAGFHGLFGSRLKVTGLTRTAEFQRRLRLVNRNAAPAQGDIASSHLTGAAVDIGTRDLTTNEIAWLRHVLGRLVAHEVVLAIEEFLYPHFHVLVLREYQGYARTVRDPILIGC